VSVTIKTPAMPTCNQCQAEGTPKACVCGGVAYCGTECQKKHWRKHKEHCPPFLVRKVEGKGNGLIAVRKICFGEQIMHEKPLLVIENNKTDNFMDWCECVVEKIDSLDDDKIEVFKHLADNENFKKTAELLFIKCKKGFNEEKLKYLRILRTNGINIDDEGIRTCVFPQFSLLNHSCAPNAVRNVEDEETGDLKVIAARDIAKGEEITIKYFSQEIAALKREKRLEKLVNWGFTCNCEICSLEGEELEHNEKTREALETAKTELRLCPTDPTNVKSLQNQRKLELNILNLLVELKTQLLTEIPDHLMGCHHVTKLLMKHGQKVKENPDKFRTEALHLSQKLGSKFISEFTFWDNLTKENLKYFRK